MFARRYAIALFLAALIAGHSAPSFAQATFTQVQKLDFGKWFFGDNNGQLSIIVTPTGSVSNSPSLTMFRSPKPGIYNITGLPAFTTFNSVNVTVNQSVILGGKSFDLDNFTTQLPDADGSGATQLRIGAELTTSGDGQPYPGGVYDGVIDIEIDY